MHNVIEALNKGNYKNFNLSREITLKHFISTYL